MSHRMFIADAVHANGRVSYVESHYIGIPKNGAKWQASRNRPSQDVQMEEASVRSAVPIGSNPPACLHTSDGTFHHVSRLRRQRRRRRSRGLQPGACCTQAHSHLTAGAL
eukprot:365467-Chlamydomonas_euryale.AAC.8